MARGKITVIFLLLGAGLFFRPQPLWASPWSYWRDYLGRRAFEKKQWNQAAKNFEEVIASDPKAEDFYNLGATEYRQGDFEAARKNFSAALSADQQSLLERSYYNLGNSLYRLGQLEASVEAYRKALQIDPRDREAQLNLEFVRKKLEEKKPPQENPQNQQSGSGEKKGEGQSQEGKQQETAEQKPNPQGEEGQGREEEQPQGESTEPSGEKSGEAKEEKSKEEKGKEEKDKEEPSQGGSENTPPQPAPGEKKPGEEQGGQGAPPPEGKESGEPKAPPESGQAPSASRGETEEPENLEGPLEPSGTAPESSGEKSKKGLERAESSPDAKEAERWLDIIEDKSDEIRQRFIQGAMGRSKTPEKDW